MHQLNSSPPTPFSLSQIGLDRPRLNRSAETGFLYVIGFIFFLLGTALFLGNRTGAMPTLPYAGFIMMTFGSLIIASGNGLQKDNVLRRSTTVDSRSNMKQRKTYGGTKLGRSGRYSSNLVHESIQTQSSSAPHDPKPFSLSDHATRSSVTGFCPHCGAEIFKHSNSCWSCYRPLPYDKPLGVI